MYIFSRKSSVFVVRLASFLASGGQGRGRQGWWRAAQGKERGENILLGGKISYFEGKTSYFEVYLWSCLALDMFFFLSFFMCSCSVDELITDFKLCGDSEECFG